MKLVNKNVDENSTQVSSVITKPADTNINLKDDEDKKRLDESDMTLVGDLATADLVAQDVEPESTINNPCMQPVEPVLDKKDDSQDYTDSRYEEILSKLVEKGYDAKFYGSEGYLIYGQESKPFKIICRSIHEGFKVNIIGDIFSGEDALELTKSLKSASQLVIELNDILFERV